MTSFIKKYISEIALLFLIFFLNMFLTTIPLTNLLSYESSAINAIVLSLFSGFFWLRSKAKIFNTRILVFLISFLLIPFIILFISTILCQKCPIDDGIYFYLIITVPSIPIGMAIADFSIFISKRFKYAIYLIIWIIMILGFLPELYYNPQIYFFNLIFGYYPGVIYDQHIAISREIIDYRLLSVVISVTLILIFRREYNFSKLTKAIVIIAVISVYLHSYMYKFELHYSTDINRIKSELKDEISTKHFNIILPDSISEIEKKIIEYEHEYYFTSISNLLKVEPDSKITSIIFDTRARKKKLFGSENADVAKPWLNQIYLNIDNYRNSLKHELAHIFSAKFGSTIFKIPSNFNPGLIEGFAMAVENNYDNFDIDYFAALAFNNNFKISLVNLFSDFSFFSNTSSLSYIYAGSFIKYLAQNYGWEHVERLYANGDFESSFNKNIEELEIEYFDYIKLYGKKFNKDNANYYFGRRPLIKRICARATAKQLKQAYKLFEQKNFIESSNLFDEIYKYSKTYSSLVGYAQSQLRLGNANNAINRIEDDLDNYANSANQYYLEFILADLYALKNDSANANQYYNLILQQNPHHIYYTSALNKKNLLQEGDSILIKYILDNKFKVENLENIVKENPTDEAIFLLTRINGEDIYDYYRRMKIIEEAVTKNKFLSETYFNISKFAYNHLDLDLAIKYARLSIDKATPQKISIIQDHIAKINWILKQK